MQCPHCRAPMTQGKKSWICEECHHHEPLSPRTPPAAAPVVIELAGLERLPSVLALPLREYAETAHPVLRLHRLCDAVEILTRFCTLVALAEVRVLSADS